MLHALGIDEFEERIYRAALKRPSSSVAALMRESGAGRARVCRSLDRLAELELVQRSDDGTWVPNPPDGAVRALVQQRESELAHIKSATDDLLEDFRTGHLSQQPTDLLQVVRGRPAIHRQAQEARRLTRDELLVFDKPPYVAPDEFDELDEERQLLSRQVQVRAIYCAEAVRESPWPDRLTRIRALRDEGEHARVLPSLPIKLTVHDRRLALVPLTIDEHATESLVVVHESGLLKGLIALFEAHWKIAHPLDEPRTPGAATLTDDEREVLAMLAAGLKDDAIARQLDVSARTVRRRVARLLEILRVSTRFQAGIAATREGWI